MGRATERLNSQPPPCLSCWPGMELRIQMLPPRGWGQSQGQDSAISPVLLPSIFRVLAMRQVSPLMPHSHCCPLQMSSLRPCGWDPKPGGHTAGTNTKLWLGPLLWGWPHRKIALRREPKSLGSLVTLSTWLMLSTSGGEVVEQILSNCLHRGLGAIIKSANQAFISQVSQAASEGETSWSI